MKHLNINFALYALTIGLFLAFSYTAQAATLTVNSLSDTQLNDGACTLREAIINANADNQTGSTDCTVGAGADTINITTAGTINLLAALPDLTTDMTINGLGAANTTVRRDAAAATEFRIFTKTAGTSTISNLTVRDGIARGTTAATGGIGEGGGIFNSGGQLTLTNVTVTNNRAIGGNGTGGAGGQAAGGGISATVPLIVSGSTVSNNTATGGTGTTNGGLALGGGIVGINALLTVSDSTISGNTTTGGIGSTNGSGFGGGINVNNNASLNMTNSAVSNNTATGEGGITNINGTVTLTNSIVSGNTATNGGGGGIGNNTATLTLTNSTVSNNSATNGGGGGLVNFGTANVTNSTLSGNAVNNFTGGAISNQPTGILNLTNSTVSGNTSTLNGGGLRNLGTANLTSSTFSNNSAAGTGGGISNSGTTTLDNTIIANSLSGGDCVRPGGTINATYSLIEQNLTCVNGMMNTNNLTGDPNLGALANNGGATQTHALQTASIAIDTGNSSLTTDQRGSPRPVDIPSAPNGTGNIADIGSFEVQSEPSPAPAPYLVNSINDPGNGTCDAAECTLREAINAANAAMGFNQQINFDPSLAGQTITLTVGQLPITDVSGTLTINGLGTNQPTVSGNNASRVFSINSGVNATINSISVTGGNGVGSNSSGNGGGILNSGILTLTGLTVNSNSAANFGGGIYNTGTATLTNLVFNANSANNGAGVGNVGTLTITDSTVANNTTVTGSPVTNSGGGLYNFPGGTMTVNGSTVNGNSTTNTGAGIFNGGTLTINNSTVSSNTAAPFGGGGIRVEGGTANATLNSSTISNNPAGPNTGGGISVVGGSIATLNNTIVANSPTGGDCFNNASTINATYSLIEDNLTCVNGMMNTNNLTGDPNLEGLGNNGGSTQTHKLLPGSIAIDAGSNALVPIGFTTDQRGQNRIIDGDGNGSAIVDMGSFEALTTTAASVSISGRVLSSVQGRGVARAVVHITDQDGNIRTARTNPFGYYRFTDVAVGQTLIVNVFHKQYQFNPQVVSINDHIANLDFTPQNNQINR